MRYYISDLHFYHTNINTKMDKVEYSVEPYYLVIRIDEDRVAKFGMDIIKSIEIIRYSSFRSADCRVGQQG